MMDKLKAFGIALIRTSLIPPAVGYSATKLPMFSHNSLEIPLTFLFSGIYYTLFHGIEVLASKPLVRKWAGIFLGYPSAPTYKENK